MKDLAMMLLQNLKKHGEWIILSIIMALSVLPRLIFISVFPSQFVSDFAVIFRFGLAMSKDLFARGEPAWNFINPGTPFFLSLLFRTIPADPELVARWATALIAGMLPLIPFLVWRNIFSLQARTISAFLLALWPGQIIFSGIPSQDNWLLFPALLLCAMCVRNLVLQEGGFPFWGAVLYILAVFIRQEMFVVLLPALFVILWTKTFQRFLRNLFFASVTLLSLLFILILYRGTATGNYTLTTSHFGEAMLGSYVPGSGKSWADPKPYLAANAPHLLYQNQGKLSQKDAISLVWQEIQDRPVFHIIRVISLPASDILSLEGSLAYWSLTNSEFLSGDYKNPFFINEIIPKLKYFSLFSHFLFGYSIIFVLLKKKDAWPAIFLFLILLLKVIVHAFIVSQSRFYLMSIALEFLVIGVVADSIFSEKKQQLIKLSLFLTCACFIFLASFIFFADKYISTHDEIPQYSYSFPIYIGNTTFDCEMDEGLLFAIYFGQEKARIHVKFPDAEPRPGEKVEVRCKASGILTNMSLNIYDYYQSGDLPDRIKQVLYVNEKKIFVHDIADKTWSGANRIELEPTPQGTLSFSFQLVAIHPDPGLQWGGNASQTTIEFLVVK